MTANIAPSSLRSLEVSQVSVFEKCSFPTVIDEVANIVQAQFISIACTDITWSDIMEKRARERVASGALTRHFWPPKRRAD